MTMTVKEDIQEMYDSHNFFMRHFTIMCTGKDTYIPVYPKGDKK